MAMPTRRTFLTQVIEVATGVGLLPVAARAQAPKAVTIGSGSWGWQDQEAFLA